MIIFQAILLVQACFGVDPGSGSRPGLNNRIRESTEQETRIFEEKRDEKIEFMDDFLVETFLPESMMAEKTKSEELLVENLAPARMQNLSPLRAYRPTRGSAVLRDFWSR